MRGKGISDQRKSNKCSKRKEYMTLSISGMEIHGDWTPILALATILSVILLWTHHIYVVNLEKNKKRVQEKVKEDVRNLINDNNLLIKEYGEEEFAQFLYDTTEFKVLTKGFVPDFEKMFSYGIAILIFSSIWIFLGMIHIFIPIACIYSLLICIFVFGRAMYRIRGTYNKTERYLDGEKAWDILSAKD